VITRANTRGFHGGVFEFLRDDKLDARNTLLPKKTTLRFNGFVRAVVDGWEVSGTTRFQSGGYANPRVNTFLGGRRPDSAPGVRPNLPKSEKTPATFINIAAFVKPPQEKPQSRWEARLRYDMVVRTLRI
jgi:hypothetical protein